MKRFALILVIFGCICAGCRDEFNDPNPDYEEIIDTEAPQISALNIKADTTYRGLQVIPLSFELTDDHLLGSVRLQLATLNVADAGMNFTLPLDGKSYQLDTFYTLPAVDTTEMTVVVSCDDYAGNGSHASYTVTAIK